MQVGFEAERAAELHGEIEKMASEQLAGTPLLDVFKRAVEEKYSIRQLYRWVETTVQMATPAGVEVRGELNVIGRNYAQRSKRQATIERAKKLKTYPKTTPDEADTQCTELALSWKINSRFLAPTANSIVQHGVRRSPIPGLAPRTGRMR
eukprot:4403434-Prymnesium_polylepis.1